MRFAYYPLRILDGRLPLLAARRPAHHRQHHAGNEARAHRRGQEHIGRRHFLGLGRAFHVGGGAELRSIADFAQGSLGRNVRIGRPRGLTGLPPAQSGPAFATLAGLVLFAAAEVPDIWHMAAPPKPSGGGGRLVSMIEKLRGSL